jgi:YidC/Oxa1 family membrane protein insertase
MQFLSNMMLDALRFFAYFGGYGWGIIWLTIAVNLALYPLTLSSVTSMAAMQKVQPRLQELQKKFKDKPQELQKETMDLYKSEGVNPLGGCLPMLLKIPFFLALFWAFQSATFLGIASNPNNNTSFLWISGRVPASAFQSSALVKQLASANVIIQDKALSQQAGSGQYVWNAISKVGEKTLKDLLWNANEKNVDDVERVGEGLAELVPKLKDEDVSRVIVAWKNTGSLAKPDRVNTPFGQISLLALLVGLTTFLMQKTMPGSGTQQTQAMTMFMPLFLVFICWNFPAGVTLYWLMSNLIGAAQQHYITKKPARRPKKKGDSK